jgi:penicillin G amidase
MVRIDLRKWGTAFLAGTILVLVAGAYALVVASLPRRSGEAAVRGLSAPLTVELDAHAIARVRAASFTDALRAQGYMHAQERFFEMDLLRRASAGELAALVGAAALARDRSMRPLQFRRRARELLASLPAQQIAWLAAYADGVNSGLEDLGARPPEYWLLGTRPDPWTPEDSLLVAFALCTMLSENHVYELPQGVMRAVLPPALYEFLTPSTSRFDAPLVGAAEGPDADPTGGYVPLPIPGADVVDLHTPTTAPKAPPAKVDPPLLGPASNQWAVAPNRSARGDALLANDPHLELRLPNIFYRAELYWPGHAARGVGIPGLPGILIGASDQLAWGATVANADQSDWVVVEPLPSDPSRYRTPEGSEPFRDTVEQIAVAGGAPETLDVRSTRWGPVTARDWRGRSLALHATWLEPGGLNLDLLELAQARTVADGAAVLGRWAGPSLNWMLADAAGGIGWIVNGPMPKRVGFDGSAPADLADGSRRWEGRLAPPALFSSPTGALFTANNRTLPPERAAAESRMWMRPLRAWRIRELLATRERFSERDFLSMQLDTRAEGYDQIRDVLLASVPSDETDPLLERARAAVIRWNGTADTDQVGFRILHVYYRALLERVLGPLLAPAAAADPSFVYRWPLADEPLRRILEERPLNVLPAGFADWPQFLRQVLLDALVKIDANPSEPGVGAAWGRLNTLDVEHPFAALPVIGPLLKPWLTLPATPLPGSMVSLRVAAPRFGAVLRMVVSPAHPEDGILEMSGGESGHFLSPNFRDLEADWAAGSPTPFLAGNTVAEIRLQPLR